MPHGHRTLVSREGVEWRIWLDTNAVVVILGVTSVREGGGREEREISEPGLHVEIVFNTKVETASPELDCYQQGSC